MHRLLSFCYRYSLISFLMRCPQKVKVKSIFCVKPFSHLKECRKWWSRAVTSKWLHLTGSCSSVIYYSALATHCLRAWGHGFAGGAGGGGWWEGGPLGLSLGYFERGNAIPWLAGYSLPEGMRPQARWDMTVVLEMGGGRTTGTVPGLI